MPIKKIPQNYIDNDGCHTPIKTALEKANELVDAVNDITDGAGTETFENIAVTDTATIDHIAGASATFTDTVTTVEVATDLISEDTVGAGVTIDGVLIKDSLDGSSIVDKTTTQTISGTKIFSSTSGILTDIVNERTAGAGVTVSGTLIKDGSVLTVVGLVGSPSVQVGSADTGLYQVSSSQTGFAQDGALVAGFNTTGLFTDVISEQTSTLGVTVDGVLLKDGGVSANSMFAGFYPVGAEQALSGPGAINLTSYNTKFTSTGTGDALTLANGSQIGQKKKVMYVAEGAGGDTGVLTLTGYTSITFNAINDYIILIWNGTAWFILESVGVTTV